MVKGLYDLMCSEYHDPVNLGNPYEMSLLELAETVIDVTGSRSEIVYEALPEDDPKVRQPDITLAREVLNWEPRVELAEGLKMTIERSGIERLVGT
jgi:dTDP-glucose 4,6-dehydratase